MCAVKAIPEGFHSILLRQSFARVRPALSKYYKEVSAKERNPSGIALTAHMVPPLDFSGWARRAEATGGNLTIHSARGILEYARLWASQEGNQHSKLI